MQKKKILSAETTYKENDYHFNINDILNDRYVISKVLGYGSFSRVVSALDLKNDKKEVAIKICKYSDEYNCFRTRSEYELYILKELQPYAKSWGFVKFIDSFNIDNKHLCLVQEMLSYNLYEILVLEKFNGLDLSSCRIIGKQLFKSLYMLKKIFNKKTQQQEQKKLSYSDIVQNKRQQNPITNNSGGLVHSDIKLENILLGKSAQQIKLLDFSCSRTVDDLRELIMYVNNNMEVTRLQSKYYRSPEMILQITDLLGPSMDVWSVACVLFELYTGIPLFPIKDDNNVLYAHIKLLGIPSQSLIRKAPSHIRSLYFYQSENQDVYKLIEKQLVKRNKQKQNKHYKSQKKIDDFFPTIDDDEKQEKERTTKFHDYMEVYKHMDTDTRQYNAFIDLLKCLLVYDPNQRLTPKQALQHSFFTMKF